MQISSIVIVMMFVLTIFAIYKENQDGDHSYRKNIPEFNDSKSKLFKKLSSCLDTDKKIVKWRRCWLFSFLTSVLIFLFVKYEIPTKKDFILCVFLIYVVLYISWTNYINTIGDDNRRIAKKIIFKLN